MKLNKRYQDGGRQQPQQPQRDTIRRVLQGVVDSDQGAIPMSEYTQEEMEAYEKYSEENFPFVDFDIHEFVADRRARQSEQMKQADPTLQDMADAMNEYGLMNPFETEEEEPAPTPTPAPQPQRPAAIALRRMFPIPPPQNQILGTDERQLQEMLLDERKKGREAVRIMKADQQMRTGASPNYDVYWDENKRQWKMREIPQEEIDRYRRENAIRRTSVSF